MAAFLQFLSHLYTLTVVFFTILLLELVILVRTITAAVYCSKDRRPITTTRYLEIIEEKSPASRFKAAGSRVDPIECAVCLAVLEDGDEIRDLKCNHKFHKICLDTWLQQDWATCPLCRTKVLPEEVVVRFRQRLNPQEYDGSDGELIFLLSALHGNNLHRLL